ncbi:MAG: FecR domain-containing protein [Hyphomicrobiales bacterium]|nr:FecR domain-containing protein [Hyphomicrobiales bacterium]MCP5370693.1 FecR domain-containing protein [Hyphomicrobiales bacterium]
MVRMPSVGRRRGAAAALALAAVLLVGAAGDVRGAENVGVVATAKNKVTGTLAKKVRPLKTRSDVFRDEMVETFAAASAQLLFLDETTMTLGPNSQVVLDEMVYDPRSGAGSVALSVVRGAARFVTGIQDPKIYVIRTPTSNIGVRGTALGIIVGAAGQTIVILLEGVAIVRDLLGRAQVLDQVGTYTVVGANNTPPSPPAPAPPTLLNQMDNTQSLGDVVDSLFQLPQDSLPLDLQDFVTQEQQPAGGTTPPPNKNNYNIDND